MEFPQVTHFCLSILVAVVDDGHYLEFFRIRDVRFKKDIGDLVKVFEFVVIIVDNLKSAAQSSISICIVLGAYVRK